MLKKINLFSKLFFDKKLYFNFCKSQNNNEECEFLKKIENSFVNKYFVEIGYHHLEFNSIGLIESNFSGCLIDKGRTSNMIAMKLILLIIGKKIDVLQRLITEKNVSECLKGKKIGSFSIDIDGNDYWIGKMLTNILTMYV